MVLNLSVLFTIILASTCFLRFVEKNKKIILLHFCLLLATPWFFILLLADPLHSSSNYYCNTESNNFTCITSLEYVFFEGERNIHHKLGDYQLLLPSLIPLILIGLYQLLTAKQPKPRFLLIVFPFTLLLLGLANLEKHFISALLIAVPLSLYATVGAYHLILNFPRQTRIYKLAFLLLCLWIAYETLRMYQIILFHKPFII